MGIVNVTPDSFSDGGKFFAPQKAIEHALQIVEEGADWIDVGGESSRPGAKPISLAEELRRVIPVIEGIRKHSSVSISIDTTKSAVAHQALSLGANMVNDISAGRADPETFSLIARFQCELCLMHMQGTPEKMQTNPLYSDVVQEVLAFLKERGEAAIRQGIAKEKIWLDPGIGFGKRVEDNLCLLQKLSTIKLLNFKVILGTSRKSFISSILESPPPEDRLEGSLASLVPAFQSKIDMVRVHDVRATRRFLKVLSAVSGLSF